MQKFSISTKVKRFIWAIGLANFLLVFLVTSFSETDLLKQQSSIEMQRVYDAVSTLIDKYFFNNHQIFTFIVNHISNRDNKNIISYFKKNLPKFTENSLYILLNAQNKVIYINNAKFKSYIGLDMSEVEYVKSNKFVSKVHQSFFTSRSVITFTYKTNRGYKLLVEKDIAPLAPILDKVKVPSIKGSIIFILTRDGTVVYHPDHELIQRRENLRHRFAGFLGPDKYGLYTLILDDKEYWCFKQTLALPHGWHFYAAIPMKNIMPFIWQNLWPILAAIFLIFFTATYIIENRISDYVSKPINYIANRLTQINPKNPNTNWLPKQFEKIGSIELEIIIKSINNFLKAIKKSQQELLKRDEILRTVIEFASDWAYWIDEKGNFKYNSRKCEEITGYTTDEFKTTPSLLIDIVHPDDRSRFEDHLRSIKSHEPHKPMEFRIIRKDGSERWISHSCTKVYDKEGRFLGVRGSNLDITEQKLAAIELAKIDKLESLGLVAGGIAHDFNNLLTAILGNISLVKIKLEHDGGVYERLEAAEKAAIRAQSLTQRLLTFAKGGAPIKKVSSLKKIILETADFVLKGSNVACKFDFAKDLWAVNVDPGQISQVIQNLVINADQAMPKGGTISIKAKNVKIKKGEHEILSPGRYVLISIEDQGVGISKENLSKIFDPYFTTKKMGSGLGLAVCFSVIRKHDGHIQVESELGKGTRFDIYLPAVLEEKGGDEIEEEISFRPKRGRRILVMDDEQNILDLLKESLEYLGYEAEVARDGREAIALYEKAKLEERPFDAVIMDMTVPGGMGGKEAIKILLKKDPKAKVIVSTGYAKDEVIKNYKKYGFHAALPKPYKLENLNKVLLKVFSNG